jgi:hypothetical protein
MVEQGGRLRPAALFRLAHVPSRPGTLFPSSIMMLNHDKAALHLSSPDAWA